MIPLTVTWHAARTGWYVALPSSSYVPRCPAAGPLHRIVREYFETFRVQAASLREGEGLPRFVETEFRDYLVAPIVVVAADGQQLPALPPGVILTHDEREGRGPLEGLRAGLKALPADVERAYVTSCDVRCWSLRS